MFGIADLVALALDLDPMADHLRTQVQHVGDSAYGETRFDLVLVLDLNDAESQIVDDAGVLELLVTAYHADHVCVLVDVFVCNGVVGLGVGQRRHHQRR